MSRTNSTRDVVFMVCGIGAVFCMISPPARAQELGSDALDTTEPSPRSDSEPATDEVSAVLMDGVSARGPNRRAVMAALAGYDGLRASALFQSRVEVRLTRALTLTGAFVLASGVDQSRIQPRIGLKLQVLSQLDDGVDLAVGGGYRRDRYAQDDGMAEVFVAAGRTLQRLSFLANLVIGSDLEGDDRKGDVRLSAMRAFGRARDLQLGFGLSGEMDLASFDPRRSARSDSTYEGFAGPMATYSIGTWALLVEGGSVLARTDRTRVGMATLGGVGAVF